MHIDQIEEKFRNRIPSVIDVKQADAVLVPLVETEQGVCLLFETRSQSIVQPGEVCFPGGKIEKGETPREAAVRETVEELGVKESDIEIIGEGDSIHGGISIYPFVAKLKSCDFHINSAELSEVFTIPLSWLMSHEPEVYRFDMIPDADNFDMSVFGVQNKYPWRRTVHTIYQWQYEGHHLWGLSAKITKNIIEILTEK